MTPLTDAEAALLDGCCLVFGTGSRLYGCAEPGSDRDLRGIAAPTRADYLELRRPRERTVAQGADVQTWGLHHWCDMFAKGSPNAMEVALLPPSAVVRADPLGRAAMDAARGALHAGFIPHLAHYAHNQHHMYARGDQPGKRLMHAVRVMRLAVSLASTGTAELADPDAASLLAIRRGALMASTRPASCRPRRPKAGTRPSRNWRWTWPAGAYRRNHGIHETRQQRGAVHPRPR